MAERATSAQEACSHKAFHGGLIKGLTGFLQPESFLSLFKPRMVEVSCLVLLLLVADCSSPGACSRRPRRRAPNAAGSVEFFIRLEDPQRPRSQEYKDPKLRGLTVEVEVSPQPVKLSEIRQLDVKTTLKSDAKTAIALDFPTDQRIEIFLINSEGTLLDKMVRQSRDQRKTGNGDD